MPEPTQPASQPTFDSNLTNVAQPDASHQANGWAANEIPSSQNFNWLFAFLALWNQYFTSLLNYWLGANANEVLTITSNAVVPTLVNSTFQSAGGTINNATPTNFKTGRVWTARGNGTNPVVFINAAGGSGQFTLANGVSLTLTSVNDTAVFQYDGANWVEISRSVNSGIGQQAFQGRLTAATGVPITTTDQLAVTTLYLTPFRGSLLGLYNGSGWVNYQLAEISLAVPATTSTMYDVFVYLSSGVLTLEAVAWTNSTTRATAIVLQNGIYCKSGALSHRYVGSFFTGAVSGQTEDSAARRYVWNYYNRAIRKMYVQEASNQWTISSSFSTWAFANGNTADTLQFVVGVSEDAVMAQASITGYASAVVAGVSVTYVIGIGLDSTTPLANSLVQQAVSVSSGSPVQITAAPVEAEVLDYIAIGKHQLNWLLQASGPTVFLNGYSTLQTGIFGEILG